MRFLPTAPTIVVTELSKTWPGGTHAVRGISFEVAAGEVFGLLGRNGAGKSTTVGMLTTTVAPSGGRARVHGHNVATDPLDARSVSAAVFQDAFVDRALSGRQNMRIHARLWGVAPDVAAARIDRFAHDVGLTEVLDRPAGTYSGAQRRRLEIARALLSEPRVLILDEPTVGLDQRTRFELLELIAALRARTGMTVLLTTQQPDEAERLCDRVAIMQEGRIVACGAPAALLGALGAELTTCTCA